MMQRPTIPWLWLALPLLVLLLPGPLRGLLLDVLGGITLTLLLLPLLGGVLAVIAWQVLRRRLRRCPACGLASLGNVRCPACGTPLDAGDAAWPAEQSGPFAGSATIGEPDPSSVTINVDAVDVSETAEDVQGSPPRP